MSQTMRDRFHEVALDLLVGDPDAVVVLAAIGASRFQSEAATAGVDERVIDVGIREQTMIGVAGGLALEGFRPIVMSYAPFLVERPFEQIKLSLTHQGAAATLVSVGASWDASTAGRTHQAPEDIALMSTLPGWTLHVPGHADEVEMALRHAHASGSSHYIRLAGDTNQKKYAAPTGRISTLVRGSAVAPTVLAVGPMADAVLDATADMDATVLYTSVASPIDAKGLAASVLGDSIVIVEPTIEGTLTAQVSTALCSLPMRIMSIGVRDPELAHYGTSLELRAAHGLDAAGIRSRILALSPALV